MEKVVVLFTKPFGAYARGDRAGFDADAAKHLKELGVAEPDADQVEQEPDGLQPAQVGAAAGQPLQETAPDQVPAAEAQQAPQASEPQSKPAGKAPKSAKA